MIKVIGLVIGILILAVGLYYLTQTRDDPDGRKIYLVASVIGALLTVACLLMLLLGGL